MNEAFAANKGVWESMLDKQDTERAAMAELVDA